MTVREQIIARGQELSRVNAELQQIMKLWQLVPGEITEETAARVPQHVLERTQQLNDRAEELIAAIQALAGA